ncbi:ATP-binding protein [Undibacterium sp.]|uniref:ATP-binding protein n=1 Tax=Undibacterium sp. TaxID=1914977 RepID=UPI00374D457E
MAIDTWLPNGYRLPTGESASIALFTGKDWQILQNPGRGRSLIVTDELVQRWMTSGLLGDDAFKAFNFGDLKLQALTCSPDDALYSLSSPDAVADSRDYKNAALKFADALRCARDIDVVSPLQDSLYVEQLGLLLPTYAEDARVDDDIVLGSWLAGGVRFSVNSVDPLSEYLHWLDKSDLLEIIEEAGLGAAQNREPKPLHVFRNSRVLITEGAEADGTSAGAEVVLDTASATNEHPSAEQKFELAGRPELAEFFNEHIVDIIRNQDRYKALGIGFPSAVILHGPPGCGKTYAVERLIDFLGWPSFQIEASSVASCYIHETSRKIAEIFKRAMRSSPSVIVIDEMESYLADREMGKGHHRVEEVAEFLRRIPEAVQNQVLIIAMTNRIEMIDPAILRRGRFDHIVKVDYASKIEVHALLEKLLEALPRAEDIDTRALAAEFAGRPLSDVAFIVREGARLAVRSGKSKLDQASLSTALLKTAARKTANKTPHQKRTDPGE